MTSTSTTPVIERHTVNPLDRPWGHWLQMAFLIVIGILTLMPLLWVIATSFRTLRDSFTVPPVWIHFDFDFSNYQDVFDSIPFLNMTKNSFVYAGGAVLGTAVTAALAGYAFARLQFRGRDALFWVVLSTMMVPGQMTIIPVYILMGVKYLNLVNTIWSLVVPSVFTAFGTFLLRQYFKQIPADFEESAIIDGANQWQIFRRIYLPLAVPGIAILSILTFNGRWNDYFTPLVLINSQHAMPITMGIVELQGEWSTGSISVVFAGIVLSVIPVIVIYILGQRYLLEGLMMGGIKG